MATASASGGGSKFKTGIATDQRNRDLRDHLEAIIAKCEESPDPWALREQLKQLRGEIERADLARMYREAVRRLQLQ